MKKQIKFNYDEEEFKKYKRENKFLFAIYHDGKHIGNCREWSKNQAIKLYLIEADLTITKKLLSHYKAVLAIEGVHYNA